MPPTSKEIDPDAVATAAAGSTGVARLSGGLAGEVATYLPGRRVTGVRVRDDEVAVHVVGVYGIPVQQTGELVRVAVAPLTNGLPVTVTVDDIALPGEPAPDERGAS